jgi:hypothetical protein
MKTMPCLVKNIDHDRGIQIGLLFVQIFFLQKSQEKKNVNDKILSEKFTFHMKYNHVFNKKIHLV